MAKIGINGEACVKNQRSNQHGGIVAEKHGVSRRRRRRKASKRRRRRRRSQSIKAKKKAAKIESKHHRRGVNGISRRQRLNGGLYSRQCVSCFVISSMAKQRHHRKHRRHQQSALKRRQSSRKWLFCITLPRKHHGVAASGIAKEQHRRSGMAAWRRRSSVSINKHTISIIAKHQ